LWEPDAALVGGKRRCRNTMSESPRVDLNEPADLAALECRMEEVVRKLAGGAPLSELLDGIAAFAERAVDRAACAIWLLDGSAVLRRGAARGVPDEVLERLDGLPAGIDVASCGAAAARRARFVVSDIAAHPNWREHREPTLTCGFQACWSTPILCEGRVWGTIAIYARERRTPSSDECARLDAAANIAAIALTRARAQRERAALQAHLRDTEPLRALGRLTGGLAHDLNNILTAIMGHTHLALLDLEEERPIKSSLIEIQEASSRAADVVRRILTFRRPRPPQKSAAHLEPILADALVLLRSALPSAIAIDSRMEDETPEIYADSAQIHQVILSLCTHAAQNMGERGHLSLELESVSAQHEDLENLAARSGRYVRLSVRDDGPGLASSVRGRILETPTEGEATGLELSLAHDIIKAHDGVIAVHARPGEGSEFRLYLPEAPPRESSRPPPAESERTQKISPAAGAGVRVMYVDDEEPLVALAVRWLERFGYEATGFNDPVAALEAFRATPERFDAVISDFSMPALSGLDLVREIIAIRRDTIVIMSSGYVRPEDSERAKALGAVEVVHKPQGMAEFGRILHQILTERRRER
jgi:signal transduction histidine kinase/ActR/RegA family two-component response regulator